MIFLELSDKVSLLPSLDFAITINHSLLCAELSYYGFTTETFNLFPVIYRVELGEWLAATSFHQK